MNNLLFRAWYKTLNVMCDVAAINFYFGNVVLLARNEEQRKIFKEMNKKALLECDDRLSVSMNEVELMQYTGLKDKNGKEICEGDILHNPLHWDIRIEYDKGSFMARDVDKVRYNNLICNCPIGQFDLSDWEIVGNIYEINNWR